MFRVLALALAAIAITCSTAAAATTDQGYIPMSDGVTLAYQVVTPDPDKFGPGPYPTVLDYSGYGPGRTVNYDLDKHFVDRGYALAGVNIRGTGCSGGKFDYFEERQADRRQGGDRVADDASVEQRQAGDGQQVLPGHHAAVRRRAAPEGPRRDHARARLRRPLPRRPVPRRDHQRDVRRRLEPRRAAVGRRRRRSPRASPAATRRAPPTRPSTPRTPATTRSSRPSSTSTTTSCSAPARRTSSSTGSRCRRSRSRRGRTSRSARARRSSPSASSRRRRWRLVASNGDARRVLHGLGLHARQGVRRPLSARRRQRLRASKPRVMHPVGEERRRTRVHHRPRRIPADDAAKVAAPVPARRRQPLVRAGRPRREPASTTYAYAPVAGSHSRSGPTSRPTATRRRLHHAGARRRSDMARPGQRRPAAVLHRARHRPRGARQRGPPRRPGALRPARLAARQPPQGGPARAAPRCARTRRTARRRRSADAGASRSLPGSSCSRPARSSARAPRCASTSRLRRRSPGCGASSGFRRRR